MKRYWREVRELDEGKISIREFILKVMGNRKVTDILAAAAYKIYVEDGGRRYSIDDFDAVVEERESEFPLSELLGE